MWETILMSFGPSVLEALGTKFANFREKEKLNNKLCNLIKEKFKEFENSSLNCVEFECVVKDERFIELLRNYFFIVNDGIGREEYINFVVGYLCQECPSINTEDVCRFVAAIEVFYIDYLHNIIENTPGISACYQLMTISYREIISKITSSHEEFMRYLTYLQNKKNVLDDENVKIYHHVCEKEYGVIRFTGIAGAERKKPQNINEFYVENTFSYYGKDIDRLYSYRIGEVSSIKLENFFDLGNKIVLVGGAGLGKSTTLNYLFCNYEKLYNSYALKLKIDLKEYAKEIGEKKRSLLWCISNEFLKRIPHNGSSIDEIQNIVSDNLRKGKCLIILDALDEIPSQSIRNKVRDEIANFSTLYYLNKFIISTRESGYLRNRFDDTFLHIRINKFGKEQIKKYSENWYITTYDNKDEFTSFWSKFEIEVKRARCENLISNPIMLVLALVVFDIQKNLPTKRIEFYQKCIDTFLTEREDRKGAFILEEKTKSILTMNLVIPKIAHYKFNRLKNNASYNFNYSELENAVLEAIDVSDSINWLTAVKQYSTYLVERTELVQEVDEEKLDFAHKTFYEYFLAFYFSKTYAAIELVELLNKWIGDSNYDELARLLVEVIIQNNEPRQHDEIINSLFRRLTKLSKQRRYYFENIDVFDLLVDLYNHNLLQPKFHKQYHEFILRNSICVDYINEKYEFKNKEQMVKYDSTFLAQMFIEKFKSGDILEVIDCIKYLNNDFRRQLVSNGESGVIFHISNLFSLSSIKNEKVFVEKATSEIKYFLNEGLDYTLRYPQIFISVLNMVVLISNEADIEKMLSYNFEPCDILISYMGMQNIKLFIESAMQSKIMFVLFFITIVECMYEHSNRLFDIVINRIVKKDDTDTRITNFLFEFWLILNNGTYEEFLDRLDSMGVFDARYNHIYRKLYDKYVTKCKGVGDRRLKKYFMDNANK